MLIIWGKLKEKSRATTNGCDLYVLERGTSHGVFGSQTSTSWSGFCIWPAWTKKLYGPNSHKELLCAACSLDCGGLGEQGVIDIIAD